MDRVLMLKRDGDLAPKRQQAMERTRKSATGERLSPILVANYS
ncbi:MAG: hypothetical protein ACP5ON_00220 [Bacteroidota bacterium]